MPNFIRKISAKIFLPIAFLFIVAIFLIVGWFNFSQERIAEENSISEIKASESRFLDIELRDKKALESVLNALVQDEGIKDSYLNGDREALYLNGQELFSKNKDLYGITHWYFIGLDDKVFLRMHNKGTYGDVVERITYKKAKDSLKTVSGIELGKTAFALRVVTPFYKDGALIGYMELGQEIDHFLTDIRENENKSLALAVRKDHLNKDDWASVRQTSGLRNNWDDNEKYVFVSTNAKDETLEYEAMQSFLNPESFMHPQIDGKDYLLGKYESGGEVFDVGEFHIKDASGEEAGAVYVALKNTSIYNNAKSKSIMTIISLVVFSYIFFIMVWAIIKYVVINPLDRIRIGMDEVSASNYNTKLSFGGMGDMSKLAKDFNEMVEAIRKSRTDVDKKVAEQVKEIELSKNELENQQRAMLNVLSDVEEEKKKAESLAFELEKFKLAVDDASDHIAITDSDGIILYGNKAIERITGYSLKSVIGNKAGTKKNWGGYMDKSFYEDLWRTIKKEKKTFRGKVENVRKNGEKYHAETSISPILDEKGSVKFFVAIERDITKEVEVDRAKTEFVSLASHQLRTPLTAIKWNAEMLLESIPKDGAGKHDESREVIEEIYNSNQRMIDLVNALLNVSRIDLGTFAVDPKNVDLKELLSNALKELEPMIKLKKLKVSSNYDVEIKKIFADPKLLSIVIQNILSNAVKYTLEKGSVEVSIKKQEKFILFSVKDSGMGIPKNQQSKIFSKLFRAENAMQKISDGTGLGLYVAKAVVEQSGGSIWFESKENVGTTFSFTIPASGMKKKDGNKELTPIK